VNANNFMKKFSPVLNVKIMIKIEFEIILLFAVDLIVFEKILF